jgi:pantothenate kinase
MHTPRYKTQMGASADAALPSERPRPTSLHNNNQQQQANAGAAGTAATRPLRVMISGAPAAGKGTQCARIVDKVRGWVVGWLVVVL